MMVFVYVNTTKQVGDVDHIKVFSTDDAGSADMDAPYETYLVPTESLLKGSS